MPIPNWPISTEREVELLREVLDSGRWGGHSDFVKRLEGEFAGFTHCAHAISAAPIRIMRSNYLPLPSDLKWRRLAAVVLFLGILYGLRELAPVFICFT